MPELNQDLFRQACNDVRLKSDVTMHLFAKLPDVAARYNALVAVNAVANAAGSEEKTGE